MLSPQTIPNKYHFFYLTAAIFPSLLCIAEVAAPRYESGSGVERSSPQQKLEAVHPSRHSVTEGTRGSLPVSLGENAFRI